MRKKRLPGPLQEAPIGSVWEIEFGGLRGDATWIVVLVVAELNVRVGNYPCVVLACEGSWSTAPGRPFSAAVHRARGWRRIA